MVLVDVVGGMQGGNLLSSEQAARASGFDARVMSSGIYKKLLGDCGLDMTSERSISSSYAFQVIRGWSTAVKKLSKRHGALGVEEYRRMGYPAAALRNYLARLGWSHGDAEIFTDAEAREWFDLPGIGRAPARLDFAKLEHVSGRHIAMAQDAALLKEALDWWAWIGAPAPSDAALERLATALPYLRGRAKNFPQLFDEAQFALCDAVMEIEPKAAAALTAKGEDSVTGAVAH